MQANISLAYQVGILAPLREARVLSHLTLDSPWQSAAERPRLHVLDLLADSS